MAVSILGPQRKTSPPLRLLGDFHRQAEQIDKPARGGHVVAFHAEAGQLAVVQRVRAGRADGHRPAFVQPHLCRAGDGGVGVIDERLQRLAQRMEPLAVVNQLGVLAARPAACNAACRARCRFAPALCGLRRGSCRRAFRIRRGSSCRPGDFRPAAVMPTPCLPPILFSSAISSCGGQLLAVDGDRVAALRSRPRRLRSHSGALSGGVVIVRHLSQFGS